jgi:hypothetical protein
MANQAGITYVTGHGVASATVEWLDRFADLVAAREREECAKVCDELARVALSLWHKDIDANKFFWNGEERGASRCAEEIRARREK